MKLNQQILRSKHVRQGERCVSSRHRPQTMKPEKRALRKGERPGINLLSGLGRGVRDTVETRSSGN